MGDFFYSDIVRIEWLSELSLSHCIATFKGTVSREKLLNWGLWEMDWTLTIDRTWVIHIPDQRFNCCNFWNVSRLEVNPVWWLSATAAFRWIIWRPVDGVRCILVCGTQQCPHNPLTAPVLPALPPPPQQPLHYLPSVVSYFCSLHLTSVLLLHYTWYY